jgi:hypothetical protein
MNKFSIVFRYVICFIFCLCAVAYAANRQMIFTPICLLFAAAAFAARGAEEFEKSKK